MSSGNGRVGTHQHAERRKRAQHFRGPAGQRTIPKRAYASASEAQAVCDALVGGPFGQAPYRCWCGSWHLGRQGRQSTIPPRFFDTSLIAELGLRVMAHLKAEASPSTALRYDAIKNRTKRKSLVGGSVTNQEGAPDAV